MKTHTLVIGLATPNSLVRCYIGPPYQYTTRLCNVIAATGAPHTLERDGRRLVHRIDVLIRLIAKVVEAEIRPEICRL